MGMFDFPRWLTKKMNSSKTNSISFSDLNSERDSINEIYVRELAFWSCVNIISNIISNCEFKTFDNNKEVKNKEYYLWNVEPNKNQNSSEFIHKWIAQLYRNNECLIIETKTGLLVADSFTRNPSVIEEDTFTNVTVENMAFKKTYRQSEVFYFKLSQQSIFTLLNGLYESYQKLIESTIKSYKKSRGVKGIFRYETLPIAGSDERRVFEELVNEKFEKFSNSENGILPLGKGLDFEDLHGKTVAFENTRDIRSLIDDVTDFTARSFLIAPSLLRGDVQDTSKAIEQTLTICIVPLVNLLQKEINRKRNSYEEFTKGIYLQIDTKAIKHVDLLDASASIDKLVGSGAFCINDIRKVTGEPIINEPWAFEHFITRNYANVNEYLKELQEEKVNQ